MAPSGPAALGHFVDAFMEQASAADAGWARRFGDVAVAVTEVPVMSMNVAVVTAADPDPDDIDNALAALESSGMPHCLEARPGAYDMLEEIATAHDLTAVVELPLMVLPREAYVDARSEATIRQLSASEIALHARLAAAGFNLPLEPLTKFLTAGALATARCYVAEIDGEPVATGVGQALGDSVGIFNIATLAEHRGRGYGAAITAHAVRRGLEDGASWAWLNASPEGLPVYERLGFTTLEWWRCWCGG